MCVEEERLGKYKMVLIDVLKTLYNLTERFSPIKGEGREEASEEVKEKCFLKSVGMLKKIIEMKVESSQDYDVKLFAINFAINMPPSIWVSHFDGRKVVPQLVQLFQLFLSNENKKQQLLAPILVLLNNIALNIPPTRPLFYDLFFPNPIGEREDLVAPPKEIEGTLGEKLVQIMFSPNDALKILSGDLLWTICQEDPSYFSRTVGFGNGAGHLAYKGMLKMFGQNDSNNSSSPSSSQTSEAPLNVEEARRRSNFKEVQVDDPSELKRMREEEGKKGGREPTEEEIKEWEDLMSKFERLEQLGIKVQFQKEKDENKDEKEKDK